MDEKKISIPGWKIVRTIGKGSFGTVYEVEKEDGYGGVAHSALKVISIPETEAEIKAYRDDGYDDLSITAMFRSRVEDITAEFELMSRLKGNSHIVSFEDHAIVQHDHDPGYDVLIRMELLTALPDYINNTFKGNGIPERTVASLGVDICSALELCRHFNIIHRDIKPQNIFVNEIGDFKLGDFGVAKTSDHTTKATKTGTYSYMAPEVYWGRPYNATADIYSLGLVMYWMLNERKGPFLPLPPAVPKTSDSTAAMERRMAGEPLPAPKYGSEDLKRIVLKACAADPRERYANPTEMKRDLENIIRGTVRTATGSVPTGDRATVRPQRGDMPGEGTIGAYTTGRKQNDPDGTVSLFRQGQKYAGNQSDPDATVSLHRGQTVRQNTATVNSRAAFTPPTPPQNRRTEWEQPNIPEEKAANKKNWVPVLIAAIVVLILFTAIAVLLLSNCNSSKTASASLATPTATVKTTTGVSGGGTVKSTSSTPSPTPTPPTPSPTPTPPTPSPTPSPTPTPPPYIVTGEIQLKTKTGYYLKVGKEKANLQGKSGYYLEKTRNSSEAISFRVIPYSGYAVELQAINYDGTPVLDASGNICYLDAFNPSTFDDRGADLWNSNYGQHKRWVLQRTSDGTYLIYLNEYRYLFLTDSPSGDDYHDELSVRKASGTQTQEWYVEIK